MSEAIEKLKQDLKILEAMASEMDEYLTSQTLFWPLSDSSLPRLTLGGYLMRQYRLVQLREMLEPDDQLRLDAAIEQFNEALTEKVVRFEQRAHEELHARLRQWSEYLRDLSKESFAAGDFYPSAVQTRAMIRALVDKLKMPPYEFARTLKPHKPPKEVQPDYTRDCATSYIRRRWLQSASLIWSVWGIG